jgi:hypothetical protein
LKIAADHEQQRMQLLLSQLCSLVGVVFYWGLLKVFESLKMNEA